MNYDALIQQAFQTAFPIIKNLQEKYTFESIDTNHTIFIQAVKTPIGYLIAGIFCEKLCLLEWLLSPRLEQQLTIISKKSKLVFQYKNTAFHPLVQSQLHEYFNHQRTKFDVPLHLIGTEFQQKAWQGLVKIPYGSTRTYTEQAIFLNCSTATRSIAQSNAKNPISIIVPCHRLKGKDGKLRGYGGGLWRKKWLLEHEKNHC